MKSNPLSITRSIQRGACLLPILLGLLSSATCSRASAWGQPGVDCLAFLPDGNILAGGDFETFRGHAYGYVIRLNPDCTLDESFTLARSATSGNPVVFAMAVQPDGKVVLAGTFTSLGGRFWPEIARLNTDGTLDRSFNPPGSESSVVGAYCSCLVVQPDGKILVGGTKLERLNANGSLEATFKPLFKPKTTATAVALQRDGKILVGANTNLVRLNQDGSPDGTFKPELGLVPAALPLLPYLYVNALLVQKDGKILVGGTFQTPLGTRGLVRLNPDGTLDPSFSYLPDGSVDCLALQTDGKIIAGGMFFWLLSHGSQNIARLNPDGTWDPTFIPLFFDHVSTVAIRSSGGVLVGGEVQDLAGGPSFGAYVEPAGNWDATQALFSDGTGIIWLRGGSGPEIWSAAFEVSDDGTNWVKLGDAVPLDGGWHLSNVSLSAGQFIRAQGPVSGTSPGWVSAVERVVPGPQLVVPPADRTNYNATTATFFAGVNAATPCSYQWSKDGVPVPGATDRTLAIPSAQVSDSGAYSVRVSNANGSLTSPAARLTVLARPEIVTRDGKLGFVGGHFGFSVEGSPGQQAILEASADVKVWTTITTNTVSAVPSHFSDLSPGTNPTSRFYRLRLAP